MQIIAFFLAVIAMLLFLMAQMETPKKWASTNMGLAFLTGALMAQFVIQTKPFITIH